LVARVIGVRLRLLLLRSGGPLLLLRLLLVGGHWGVVGFVFLLVVGRLIRVGLAAELLLPQRRLLRRIIALLLLLLLLLLLGTVADLSSLWHVCDGPRGTAFPAALGLALIATHLG
jgi:hypothetical protein